jgi:uncharacterized peroxidase-related enzyme
LLAAFHEQLLRGESPLTVAERELIATYVSWVNRCRYCFETHAATAGHFGVRRDLIDALTAEAECSDVPERLRPMLRFARKLTLQHWEMDETDSSAVLEAGWDGRALHDLILIVATFNFMNRFVHGHGIHAEDALWKQRGQYLFEYGYADLVAQASIAGERRDELVSTPVDSPN